MKLVSCEFIPGQAQFTWKATLFPVIHPLHEVSVMNFLWGLLNLLGSISFSSLLVWFRNISTLIDISRFNVNCNALFFEFVYLGSLFHLQITILLLFVLLIASCSRSSIVKWSMKVI